MNGKTDKAVPKRPDSCPSCGSENTATHLTVGRTGLLCLDIWHDTAATTMPIHFKSGCCIGEKCSVCSEQAMHKVGEEKFPDDLRHWRHNLTAYVCCKHFKEIMGRCEPLLMPNFSEPAPLTAEENQDAGIHGRSIEAAVSGISSLGNSDGIPVNRRMGTGEVPAAPSEHSVEVAPPLTEAPQLVSPKVQELVTAKVALTRISQAIRAMEGIPIRYSLAMQISPFLKLIEQEIAASDLGD